MKYVYIPEGQTVSYEDLTTEYLVADGRIHVRGELTANVIRGRGTVSAGLIRARDIRVDDLEAGEVYCGRLTAQRVETLEVSAEKCVNVARCLTARSVKAKRLAMTGGEIICLTPRRRSLGRFRLLAALRSFWLKLTAPRFGNADVVDADYEPAEDPKAPAKGAEMYVIQLDAEKEHDSAA